MDYLAYLEGPKVTAPVGVTYMNPLNPTPGLFGDNFVRDVFRRPAFTRQPGWEYKFLTDNVGEMFTEKPLPAPKEPLFNPPLFGNLVSEAFSKPIHTSAQQCWDSPLSDSVQRAFSFTPSNIPQVPTPPVQVKSSTRKGCLKRPGEPSAHKKSVGFKAGLAFDITNGEHVPQSTLSHEDWLARHKAARRLRKAKEAELSELDLVL